MIPFQTPKTWQQRAMPAICFVLATSLFLVATVHLLTLDTELLLRPYFEPTIPQEQAITEMLEEWQAKLHPLENDTFVLNNKWNYTIPKGNFRWPKLGNRVLVVDIDTRYDNVKGGLMGKATVTRSNIIGRTAGYLNHYLFSLIHGYDYRYIRAPEYHDRHLTWVKVPIVKQALNTYDFVIFLDSDAIVQRLEMPIEWLMSLWGMNKKSLTAMAEDPNSPINQDNNGWVLWNTGFMVAQSSQRTKKMFQRWEDCPLGKEWEDCKHWAYDWAHEQAAFGTFVRYDYDLEDSLKVISCMEGNGAPYIGDKKCGGHFVAHHWSNKVAPIDDLFSNLDNRMVGALHHHFLRNLKTNFLDWSRQSYPLKGIQVT